MSVIRRRRVPGEPPPTAAAAPAAAVGPEVRFIPGSFTYLDLPQMRPGRGKDPHTAAAFKAVFEDDPEGCYGFGDSHEEAEAMLRRYAAAHAVESGAPDAAEAASAKPVKRRRSVK